MVVGFSATAVAPPWTVADVAQKKPFSPDSQHTRKPGLPSPKDMKKEGSFVPLSVRFQRRKWSPTTGFRDSWEQVSGDGTCAAASRTAVAGQVGCGSTRVSKS
ncbi:uncharacterized protein LOC105800748 [Gossypium raimondii]|uniref:uncharacterized protein LOC105800748 n=1 Tax=Gossypium raimondii TaxID=29730 RepID=UPI00227CB150|nr:uncharacterized protein LOC105800748 [Gossypium raimondii]